MPEEDKQDISKYNDALLQIGRLNDSWLKIKGYARSGNFPKWKWELDEIWRELYPDAVKLNKNKETIKEFLDLFEHKEAEDIITLNEKLREKIVLTKGKSFYESLNNRHLFMKMIQDFAGKGAVYRDRDEDALE